MQAVVFNSMLILLPVIGAQVLGAAFSGSAFSDSPGIEAIDQTRKNMDEAFASFAPRNPSDRYEFWYDVVDRELSQRDVAAAHGFLLAAPQMLDRKDVKELMVAADAERLDRADDRLTAAALRKLPTAISLKYEEAQVSERVVDVQSGLVETPVIDAADAGDAPLAGPEVEVSSERAATESRFRLLGTFQDLAENSERWVRGDRIDEVALKITAIGLLEAETADGLSDANIRAASILKSALRSRRLTDDFQDYLSARVNAALPDSDLRPALEAALGELTTIDVRTERVKAAFIDSIDARGLQRLETDLEQIDRIGLLTSPAAAVTLIEQLEDSADLRRVRLIAEAGGDRAVALVKQSGAGALRIADTGVRWTIQMVLQVMGMTAAGLALIFVTWSTFRRNIRKKKKLEPMGA
ncbi:MAG TPA: hypothetical protein DCG58_08300 [Hyphomonas adhaerens]|uniref:Uncharacterized protein n=3 Tax=Hyphomonadaceae TaxID=69657 RepID=A0A3B9GXH9_9PROT|nr:hypothetical protein [Hyphomonas sp.]HAE27147.1 hypothetical protein [Hyphomonas adhaerens]